MWGVYFEVDGLPVNALVITGYPSCLILDLSFHIMEVREAPIRDVMELCPF